MDTKEIIQAAGTILALLLSSYSLWLAKRKDQREIEAKNPLVILEKADWSLDRCKRYPCTVQNRSDWPIVLRAISMPDSKLFNFSPSHGPPGDVPRTIAIRNNFQIRETKIGPGETEHFDVLLRSDLHAGKPPTIPFTFWITEFGPKERRLRLVIKRTARL